MDKTNLRPLAKSHISDISKVCTSGAGKETVVNGEGQRKDKVQSSATKQDKKNDQIILNQYMPRRTLQNEQLLTLKDFYRIDLHAISAGEELRSKKIFSVKSIARTITKDTSTDLERLRAIWIWICHNIEDDSVCICNSKLRHWIGLWFEKSVYSFFLKPGQRKSIHLCTEYDLNGYLGLSKKASSTEHVIQTGRGVCSGFSSVCLDLCREVGIECKEVAGYGKGVGYKLGQSYQNSKSNHMWNAVQLEDQWYLLDSCWGAGKVDMNSKAFIKRYNEFYFLTDPEDFISSHWPEEEEWQLLHSPIKLEEFEKSVLKTSEFFKLGLTLIHPKQYLLITENGEAFISMGFFQPVNFTYEIYQKDREDWKELSTSMCILTVLQNRMKLQIMPPFSGTFKIMLFARPGNTSEKYSWVCSFLVECSEPKALENLPENPYLFWGIAQGAKELGIKPCKYSSKAILLQNGSYKLVLQTSRPLMMLCEINHKNLDDTLARRCLATQIEEDKLTCNVLCPYIGFYKLSVFVNDYESNWNKFHNVGNFLLHCIVNPINLNQLFPSDLSYFCGPGIRTDKAGLIQFSHTGPIVNTPQGKCNISFQNQQDLDLLAILNNSKEQSGHSLSQHVFITYNGTRVTLNVALPQPGIYKLSLYEKNASSQELNLLCDFILQNSSQSSWPPFPYTFTSWRKGCVLFEPHSGVLEPLCWVQFRVCVPGAHRVIVLGEQQVELKINESHIWEGEVFTGSMKQIQLAATQEEISDHMDILICFDVLKQQDEI